MSFYDFSPVTLDPVRVGGTEGRGIDTTLDLGAAGDTFTSPSSVTVSITRQDGTAVTSADLALAGASHPTTLDSTGLIVGFWLTAPVGAAGVTYVVTISATTTQGAVYSRDAYISVLALMG